MKWFNRKASGPETPGEDDQQQAVAELLDRHHSRASISDGDQMLIQPGQVLDNIELAMQRVDIDIDTPVSVEDDVVPFDELASLIQNLRMGPTLAVHVVNTAMRIMSARYPNELVRRPLPAQYDLRKLHPLNVSDHEHEIAKTIFNRRTASTTDLTENDVAELETLNDGGQIQVFVILFYMYGTKIGAMKHRTGTE